MNTGRTEKVRRSERDAGRRLTPGIEDTLMNWGCRGRKGTPAWVVLALSVLNVGTAVAAEPGGSTGERTAAVNKLVAGELDGLLALYKHLHAHPELSLQEEQTAARLARELKEAGFAVTT